MRRLIVGRRDAEPARRRQGRADQHRGGLPEFQAVGWNAIFAPKDTPAANVDRLNAAGRAALADAGVRTRLLELGCIIPDDAGQSSAALGAHVRAEVDKWTPVIKAAGVTAQ